MEGTFEAADALRAELERLRQQQVAVRDLLAALAGGEGLQAVFQEIVEAARRLCEGDNAQLYLHEGELLYAQAEAGDQVNQLEALAYGRAHPHAADRTTVVGRVALSGDIVQIEDVLADSEYSYGGQEIIGFRALLGVPIFLQGALIGAIALGRQQPGLFSQEKVELVRTFADQAAVAIGNARLLDAVERQRSELARFVSPQVAELISSTDGEQLLAGHRAYISCLFCDLRDFTGFVETAAPEDLLDVLRAYHTALGELIPRHGGTLEHFAGDGVMIFFNDPVPVAEHELEAVRFALAAHQRFRELAETWSKRGDELGLGIGIEAGHATLGRIGFEGRYDYGVLGPVANLASRLSTRAAPGQTLIGPRLFSAVDEVVEASAVGDLELKGFARAIPVYNVTGLKPSGSS